MPLATGGRRNGLTFKTLASANDLNGTTDGTQYLDLTGAGGCIIIQQNNGTDGTAGVDVIEFSKDGGSTWLAATQSNFGNRHLGLLAQAGTAASGAALNAAGVEGDTIFYLGPTKGEVMIRCARGSTGAGGTAWVTGAPTVVAIRIG